jgi:ketosteroid isomerase-like protein
MTRDEARCFTEEWIEAWNAFDVERVLALFAEDAVFSSPKAAALTGSGFVRGKDALRAYWGTAKSRIRSLRFTLDRFALDPVAGEIVIVYEAAIDGERKRACEFFRMNDAGEIAAGEAMYGIPL